MKVVVTIFFAFFILIGCKSPQPKSTIVQVTDKCIGNTISIVDVKGKKLNNGFMKVQITGQNLSDSYQKLQYKIIWLDKDGFIIKTILSNWQDISVDANEPFYITNISPNSKSEDFRLFIVKNNKEIECNH